MYHQMDALYKIVFKSIITKPDRRLEPRKKKLQMDHPSTCKKSNERTLHFFFLNYKTNLHYILGIGSIKNKNC